MDATSKAQLLGFAIFFVLIGLRWGYLRWSHQRRINKAIDAFFSRPDRFRRMDYGFRNSEEPTVLKQKPTERGAPRE